MRHSALDQDRISKYFTNPDLYPISSSELSQLERWNFIDDLIRQGFERKVIVAMVQKKYEISQPQAYRDINDTKIFFGSMSLESKVYDRMVIIENLNKCYKMALNKGDLKTAVLAQKAILENMGVDDENKLDFQKLMESFSESGMKVSIIVGGDTITTDISKIENGEFTDITNVINSVPTVSSIEMQNILDEHSQRQ